MHSLKCFLFSDQQCFQSLEKGCFNKMTTTLIRILYLLFSGNLALRLDRCALLEVPDLLMGILDSPSPHYYTHLLCKSHLFWEPMYQGGEGKTITRNRCPKLSLLSKLCCTGLCGVHSTQSQRALQQAFLSHFLLANSLFMETF